MNMSSNLSYTQTGDYLLPNLTLHQPKTPLGKYGRMRRTYLMNHRPVAIQHDAPEREPVPAPDGRWNRRQRAGCSRPMSAAVWKQTPAPDKEQKQMAWVQHMNSLKAQAEELVLNELIYS